MQKAHIGHAAAALVALLALTGGATPVAWGQINELPANIVRDTDGLSPDEVRAVREYVTPLLPGLSSDRGPDVRRARSELLRPLQDADAGVPFRLEYTRVLLPELTRLSESSNDVVAVNALRLAGELATDAAANLAVRRLEAPAVSVRFAASSALNAAFRAASGRFPALTREGAAQVIGALGRRVGTESDAFVADAQVRALVQASRVSAPELDLRGPAMAALADGLTERLKRAGNSPVDAATGDALIRAAAGMRDALAPGQARAVSAETARRAEALSLEMLNYVSRVVQARGLPSVQAGDDEATRREKAGARQPYVTLVATSEAALNFARQIVGGGNVPATRLAESLRSGAVADDAKFVEDVRGLGQR